MKYLSIVFLLLFLTSCASTTGYREDKTVKSDLDFRHNTGTILLYFPVDAITSDESTMSELGTSQDIAPKAETSLSRASQAGQAVSKLGAGLQMLEDLSTYVKKEETVPSVVIPNDPPSKVPAPVTVTPPPSQEPIETSSVILERLKFHKIHDTTNQAQWHSKKPMVEYPDRYSVVIEGCGTYKVTGNKANKGAQLHYGPDYLPRDKAIPNAIGGFMRQSLVPGRNLMVVVAPVACRSEKAYITTATAITIMGTYETDQYEDGRYRYLFRGVMEDLPTQFEVHLNGEKLYSVSREGDRWEGPNNKKGSTEPLLKNSHGRANSITLLLPKQLPSGTATLIF